LVVFPSTGLLPDPLAAGPADDSGGGARGMLSDADPGVLLNTR
jgi:hypothetical protein